MTKYNRILEAGYSALEGSITPSEAQLLRAIAAMLVEAKKTDKRTPKKEKPTLPYTEHDILAALPPMTVLMHGQLDKILYTHAASLQTSDPEQLGQWFQQNMQPWLDSKGLEITYSMVCKNFVKWMEKVRAKPSKPTETKSWR